MSPRLSYAEVFFGAAFAVAVVAVLAPVAGKWLRPTQNYDGFRAVAAATLQYATDNDEVLPLAMSYDTVQKRWRYNQFTAVPSGSVAAGGRNQFPRKVEESSVVYNSIRPYLNEWSSLGTPGLPIVENLTSVASPLINLNYNGLLHAWPVPQMYDEKIVPLYHQAYRQNTRALGISVPNLYCAAINAPLCRFHPRALPGKPTVAQGNFGYYWVPSARPENFTVWVVDRSLAFLQSDGSLRVRTIELPTWPQYAENVQDSPWSSFDPTGIPGTPFWMTDCGEPYLPKARGISIFYAGFFRPDNEGTYSSLECDFGGG
ncbi:MAG: hypothetical protein KIT11_03440 [Fimbriimonadaceae bacterium]|nr:hypothetical protein [Fimbriimonadaceae bacterium]QYK57049.1 MAG: hypothetical protein KF733_06085 [Fimbriimonadaceae bacterium]